MCVCVVQCVKLVCFLAFQFFFFFGGGGGGGGGGESDWVDRSE